MSLPAETVFPTRALAELESTRRWNAALLADKISRGIKCGTEGEWIFNPDPLWNVVVSEKAEIKPWISALGMAWGQRVVEFRRAWVRQNLPTIKALDSC